ncbi:MAG TPA: sigma-70 family RNA polymerase sigma factor [Gemmataceae bacterium]|nr:sigma-70 family RNA polymerase sigma factor [Gemmataceae bacterium]
MPARPAVLLRHLTTPPTDGECLERYAHARDESAFAELVRRNGPLVLRACRSVLRDPAAAEDAFQTTFLTLARNANRLIGSASVAGWLYRVAVRSAGAIRRAETRRRRREQIACVSRAQPDDVTWAEVRGAIDAEIARLPERYRTAVLLCYVQGLTYDEAAHRLGCPLGALRGRLERGRAFLRRRLERLGLPAVALLAAGVPTVSAELRAATLAAVRTAGPVAGGRLVMAALVGCLVAVASGLGLVAAGRPPADIPKPPADPPVASAPAPLPKPAVELLGDPLPAGAVARLGSLRFHHGRIEDMVVGADGRRIATIEDGQFRLWDAETGRPLAPAPRLKDGWWSFTPGPRSLGAVVQDRRGSDPWVVDPVTGEDVRRLPDAARPPARSGVGIAPDGKTVIGDRQVVSPDDKGQRRLIEYEIRCWRGWADGWFTLTTIGRLPPKFHIGFSADSRRVAVGLPNGAGVWDLTTERVLFRRPDARPAVEPNPVTLSPDGKLLAEADLVANKLRLWDVETEKEAHELPDQPARLGQAVAFSPDGKAVAAVVHPNQVRVWDLATRNKVCDYQVKGYQVRAVAFAPSGRLVAADDSGVNIWDTATGKPAVDYGGHTYAVAGVAWSPDGKRLATGAAYTDALGRVWDPATGKKLLDLCGHQSGIEAVAYSPDGRLIATGSQDGTVRLWAADSGQELHAFDAKDGMVYALTFSPGGRYLVSGGRRALHVWDLAGRKEVRTVPSSGGLIVNLVFLAGGKRLLARMTESPPRIFDFGTGTERGVWQAEGRFESAAASTDGRVVVTGHEDGAIRLWDPEGRSRMLVDPLHPHFGDRRVLGVAISPDGRALAAAYASGRVRVFETATGSERFQFPGHTAALRVAFAPDGTRLASGGSDRVAIVWDVTGTRLPSAPPPKDLDAAWSDLVNEDAARAFAAIRFLADHPDRGVALLAEKLRPVAAADAKTVATLIAQLESPKFAEREKASKELAALGEAAAGPLREADAKATSAELRQRLAPLLTALADAKPTGERLRALRAVEALERIGTPEARKLLATLAAGAAGATTTGDAKAALGRLGP